jgi:DNA-binding response OmpR family regulator/HAMP domain-containing protein
MAFETTEGRSLKIWSDFTSWAQDFSLMQKVLGGFLGVVILVGLMTSFIGTRLAQRTIIDRARSELYSDLSTAGFILKSSQETLEAKLHLMAASEKIKEYLEAGNLEALRNRLALMAVENDLDFLTATDDKGQVLARAFVPLSGKEGAVDDALVRSAIGGKNTSGVHVISTEHLSAENPALRQRIGDESKKALVIESAQALLIGTRVVGTLYGGVCLNNNTFLVNRINQQIFSRKQALIGKTDHETSLGQVTIYLGDRAISTTFKRDDGLPAVGFEAGEQVRETVLRDGGLEIGWAQLFDTRYLSAAAPISDTSGKVVGAIQVATPEGPITQVIERLVLAFILVALVGALLMGAISYFLVRWINRPLQQMLHSARRAAEGDLSHEVPVVARDEVGELAATFNLMIHNLATSKNRLEEWGKQLATKVAQKSGELDLARKQMARVKKLASLQRMADGMAHIVQQISDPLHAAAAAEEEGPTTSRVLVLDSDERVLDICQRILENEKFDVKVFTTVQDALNELGNELYDVVVADIDMPEMGGKELLQEIKYRQPEVAVIMTASFKATEDAVEAVKMGAYDYIPKPFGPHQILLTVYTALQTRELIHRTRRQHAQKTAETIFQRLPVALALVDKEQRVVYHNRAFIELTSENGEEPEQVQGKTFRELFGVDPIESIMGEEEVGGSRWLQLEKVGRTAKLYKFELPEEDLRVLMLLDVTETVMKHQQADIFKTETINKAQQVIHQQMRVAQEIAGLLGETTAETKAALFELIKLAGEEGAKR